jgi:hypothetical protein
MIQGMIRDGSDNAGRSDPLIDLLARMIRTAQEREHTERRATLTVMDGGQQR